jgi:hypothetical protein
VFTAHAVVLGILTANEVYEEFKKCRLAKKKKKKKRDGPVFMNGLQQSIPTFLSMQEHLK